MTEYLYAADALPVLQNRVYDDPAAALKCPTGDVALRACPRTGIVVNDRFDPKKVIYDAAYHNEQACSRAFQVHLGAVADLACAHLDCSSVAEIGCGKGAFLGVLAGRGVRAVGFDPAYEGSDPNIRKELFRGQSQMQHSAIVLRHVLEHIQDPVEFLRTIRDANGGTGRLYVEVPCLDWIIRHCAWFDIFYEHVNYFRMSDFERMFGTLVHAERTFGGQYLSIVAELGSLRDLEPCEPLAWPSDFSEALTQTMSCASADAAELVWGAGSKGVIYSLFRSRAGNPIAAAIDINPAKQGRYLPVTGVEVIDPDSAIARFPRGTPVWVMNPNYAGEIARLAGQHFKLCALDAPATQRSPSETP